MNGAPIAEENGVAESARSVEGLLWGVKTSLVEYVEQAVPDGRIAVSHGAERLDDGRFVFPLDVAGITLDPATGLGTAHFIGSVVLSGYGGGLNLTITEPWLHFEEDAVRVSAITDDGQRVGIALGGAIRADSAAAAHIDVVLSDEAVELFLMRYGAGQALDPISFDFDGFPGR